MSKNEKTNDIKTEFEKLLAKIKEKLGKIETDRPSIEYDGSSEFMKEAIEKVRSYPDKHNGKLPNIIDIAEVMDIEIPAAASLLHTLAKERFLSVKTRQMKIKGFKIYEFYYREDT